MDETRPRRSWLLIVSLCLNVALIGGIAVVAWRIGQFDIFTGSGGPMAPRSVMAEFPDRQPAIEKVIAAHHDKLADLRHSAVVARRDVFRLFASPGYTPQKMASALDSVATADVAIEREAIVMENESLATLSPAQRQALVERIKARNRSWFFRMFRRPR